MKTRTGILGGAALAALIGATAFTSVTSMASTPSSPAEQAATAALNSAIVTNNKAADDHYKMLVAQYEEQKRQSEAQAQNPGR